jgi:hypothetical protein
VFRVVTEREVSHDWRYPDDPSVTAKHPKVVLRGVLNAGLSTTQFLLPARQSRRPGARAARDRAPRLGMDGPRPRNATSAGPRFCERSLRARVHPGARTGIVRTRSHVTLACRERRGGVGRLLRRAAQKRPARRCLRPRVRSQGRRVPQQKRAAAMNKTPRPSGRVRLQPYVETTTASSVEAFLRRRRRHRERGGRSGPAPISRQDRRHHAASSPA